jgi:sigma-B regulation protein RsbU (phosphoserine phosphatase)
MKSRSRELLISIATVLVAYVGANAIERSFIQALQLSLIELTWISDVVLSLLLGVVTFIWLNLRATQLNLIKAEKIQIAIETELALAADIQRNLLPKIPLRTGGIRWGAILKPAGKIGGDFYDFIRLDPDTDLVLIADISGKGIPAALTLASIRTLFRMLSRETHDPSELLHRISSALYAEHQGAVFLTCILGIFCSREKTFTYVNAGHPPGIIFSHDGDRLLACGGTPAGMFSNSDYQKCTLSFQPGTVGILFTDGISEALPIDADSLPKFLRKVILRKSPDQDPQRICESILKLVKKGSGPTGENDWRDDQTVLAFLVDSNS